MSPWQKLIQSKNIRFYSPQSLSKYNEYDGEVTQYQLKRYDLWVSKFIQLQ